MDHIPFGGAMKVIACIENLVVIKQMPSFGQKTVHPCTTPLDHLKHKAETNEPSPLPENRTPPAGLQQGLFD